MKRYYLFHNNKVIQSKIATRPSPLEQSHWDKLAPLAPAPVLLPLGQESESYALSLPDEISLPHEYTSFPLRSLLEAMDEEQYVSFSKAAQLVHWYTSQRFCGKCGAPNTLELKEMAMTCTHCEIQRYPVISPCIITLIHRGYEVLLARSPRYPAQLFSTIAGFIEPGEPAELAVQREIFEEVGVQVKNIRYFMSQSWPFPGQLMLGFFAEHDSGEIVIDNDEICQAEWFHIDDLPKIPGSWTIAGKLIRHYRQQLRN